MARRPRPATPKDGAAWVTGASSGIGKSLARRLAAAGWTVVTTARSEEDLSAEARAFNGPGRLVPMAGDVTDAGRMEEIVRAIEVEHGGLALLVANAGIYRPVDGADLDRKDVDATIRINLDGTVNCVIPAIAAMKPRRAGQIAIVSSVAGYAGLPTSSAYGMTKAGLYNFAESLKFDLDNLGILVQVVSPGFIDTPATAKNPFDMPFLMDVEKAAAEFEKGLGRTGFEITFPKAFTYQLKFLRVLPYCLYFPLVARSTGWSKKGEG